MRLAVLSGSVFLCLSTNVVFAGGDPVAGAAVFKKCSVCHSPNLPISRVGPTLLNSVGRPVASIAGYRYSDAMKAFAADGKVWDDEHLTAYLANPKATVPGTKMTFAGLADPVDVANVIAYMAEPK